MNSLISKSNLLRWGILMMMYILITCNGKKEDPSPITPGTVVLNFDHTVDGAGVVYNDVRYKNSADNKYSIMTLRYYVSDITFHKYNGESVKIDTFHYRDIDMLDTRSLVIENVPDGEYTYVSFIFGLHPDKNVSYGLPPTQEHNNMEWPVPMGGGYHYMKLEGRYEKSNGETGSYNTHTGRLKTMDGTIYENFINVELPYSAFTINKNNWEIQVLMNINEWYCSPHVYCIETFGPAIMGNQVAQQTLKENGRNVFSVGYILKN
jgi:hypothetical protein